MFGSEATARRKSSAKAIAYLHLRCSEDAVAPKIEQLVNLLEQFFHPSNGGQWTAALRSFLSYLMEYFMLSMVRDLRTVSSARPESSSHYGIQDYPLSVEQQRRFVVAILKMAERALHSKDSRMMETGCGVLQKAAYVAPDLVFPLVRDGFQKALESVTSTHLLVSAIHTLALCVRPLLSAPSSAVLNEDSSSGGLPTTLDESAKQLVAEGMMATLPGIDANDPSKTLACFRFYCNVFSNGPEGGQDGLVLPYMEEWLDEFLTRVFTMLSNLDSSGGGSQSYAAGSAGTAGGDGTFLLEGTSMFRPLMDLLFSHLPKDLQSMSVRRVAQFVTCTTLPDLVNEAMILCNAAVRGCPELTSAEILSPILTATLEELPPLGTRRHLSAAAEGVLKWHMGLAAASILHMGPAVLPHAASIQRIVDQALAFSGSPTVQDSAGRMLSGFFHTCVSYFPLDTYRQGTSTKAEESRWTNSITADARKPHWHVPSSDELSLAHVLVTKYIEEPVAKILQLCSTMNKATKSADERGQLRQYVLGISAALNGLGTCLPDLSTSAEPDDVQSVSLVLAGSAGVHLTGHLLLRDKVAEALLAAFAWVDEHDVDTVKSVVALTGVVMGYGAIEYDTAVHSMSVWRADEQGSHDPAYAAFAYRRAGHHTYPFKDHRPRWLAVERCHLHGLWRASQAAYRPWLSTRRSEPSLQMVGVMYHALFCDILVKCAVHPYQVIRESATSALERSLKRFPCFVPVALPTMLCSLSGAVSTGGEDIAQVISQVRQELSSACEIGPDDPASLVGEDHNAEAAVQGACSVLRGRACWRRTARDPSALAGVMYAVCLSARHASIRSQRAINDLFLITSLRFIPPPVVPPAAVEPATHGAHPDPLSVLVHDLRVLVSDDRQLHWRYAIITNAFLFFLLPSADPCTEGAMAAHFLRLLTHEILPLRQLGLAVASIQATWWSERSPWYTAKHLSELETTFAATLSSKGYAQDVLSQLAHNHHLVAEGDISSAGNQHGGGMSREEAVVKSISATLTRFQGWPVAKKSSYAVKAGQFIVRHAQSMASLAQIAPLAWCDAFEVHLRSVLESDAILAEKSTVCAAAELLAGTIACSAAFQLPDSGVSPWDRWISQALQSSLTSCPLELADMWGLTIRFAVHGLCRSRDAAALDKVLHLLTQASLHGATSGAVIKWMKITGHCLSELNDMGCRHLVPARTFQDWVLEQVTMLIDAPSATVHQEVAYCMVRLADNCMDYSSQGPALDGDDGAHVSHTSSCAHLRLCRRIESDFAASVAYLKLDLSSASPTGGTACGTVLGSQLVESSERTPPFDPETSKGMVPAAQEKRSQMIAMLGVSLQFVLQCIRHGEPAFLSSALLGLMPSLLSVQEMPDPDLQPLAMDAKTAFALLKYVPVPRDVLPSVMASLRSAREAVSWHARASSLVYMQYFWFRQVFDLADHHVADLVDHVAVLLCDKKFEVQELAAKTLSGILKGLSKQQASHLRSSFLHEINRSQGRRVRAENSVAVFVAPVLGLKAFVLSTPYDIPSWLPEVLMALVKLARQPPPVSNIVAATLGEFTRTHEGALSQDYRGLFAPEEWEAIRSVSSTASYFV
mmetsp:Transcript_1445/g.4175  ORF Transcript_1445/g.4175 Transcript_1445/m.4175 type:complete len:1599 (-) Transcript_1445:123-4919(-)